MTKPNPIDAVKNYYLSLDNKGKTEFQKETGFNLAGMSVMSYKFAENFCKSHNINLENTSAWNLYKKGVADYKAALGEFNRAQKTYSNLKAKKDTAQTKYNTLVNNFKSSNGDDVQINSNTDKEFRQKSKFTTELIKNTNEADSAVNLALDKRFNAVNEQRHGLMFRS